MEIEKKYLIRELPANLELYETKQIEQGYLNRKPVLRIRKSNDKYILTYKGKPSPDEDSESAIVNNEIEAELTKESYYHLREKVDNHIIEKTRYIIPIGTCAENCPGVDTTVREGEERADSECILKIELDVFHGCLEGLRFAEVEFPSVDAATRFVPPEWFAEDVSMDKHYHNGYLSELDSWKA